MTIWTSEDEYAWKLHLLWCNLLHYAAEPKPKTYEWDIAPNGDMVLVLVTEQS